MLHLHPRLFVARPYLPPRQEFDKYLDEIWDNRILTNYGLLHERFRAELSQFFDGANVTLTANGHLALDIALHVLDAKGEVITTPFTFASTTHVLTWNGLTPVFCDIKENDLTLDPDKIEALITEKTSAIMPVHVYGHFCDAEKIDAIAEKHGLRVIYDAAHAFGVRVDGKSIASFGDVSMFSFHATKLFHTIEGGALVYKNSDLCDLYEASENFGFCKGEHVYIGTNAKMNEFQAAMGLAVLPEFDTLIKERKELTARYTEHLSDIKGVRCLANENPRVTHNYAYMPILINANSFGRTRDNLFQELAKHNINCRKYFYPLISDYKAYHGQFDSGLTPIAAKAADEVLCLPIYNGLSINDADRVCNIIRGLYNG
ncbi:MAG: DegT/DnrJ/EryC1/StrS family aminotransferase [Clostridiales bacterium]|jgi:dTDP-4-amino-4,6-dideoxygalactose transaminase|nr:DegT/DnrJ/EryC1/StrS family aminotransferase [Clostridiales bacterium]